MTKIKICGITNKEDAEYSYRYGADFIGFVFYTQSPRYIAPQKVIDIKNYFEIIGLNKWTPIGVFVNENLDNIIEIYNRCNLYAVQLSGDEDSNFCQQLIDNNVPLIKSIRIKDETSLANIEEFKADYLLFDKYHEKLYGGSGEVFNHDLIISFVRKNKVFLAGGLNPDNVFEIIEKVRPFAVDVSSGVEIEKGKKDYDKIRRFIQEVDRLKD